MMSPRRIAFFVGFSRESRRGIGGAGQGGPARAMLGAMCTRADSARGLISMALIPRRLVYRALAQVLHGQGRAVAGRTSERSGDRRGPGAREHAVEKDPSDCARRTISASRRLS